jgi:hypothetical protein
LQAQISLEVGVVIAILTLVITGGSLMATRFVSKDACQQCKFGVSAKIDALKELMEEKFKALEALIRGNGSNSNNS